MSFIESRLPSMSQTTLDELSGKSGVEASKTMLDSTLKTMAHRSQMQNETQARERQALQIQALEDNLYEWDLNKQVRQRVREQSIVEAELGKKEAGVDLVLGAVGTPQFKDKMESMRGTIPDALVDAWKDRGDEIESDPLTRESFEHAMVNTAKHTQTLHEEAAKAKAAGGGGVKLGNAVMHVPEIKDSLKASGAQSEMIAPLAEAVIGITNKLRTQGVLQEGFDTTEAANNVIQRNKGGEDYKDDSNVGMFDFFGTPMVKTSLLEYDIMAYQESAGLMTNGTKWAQFKQANAGIPMQQLLPMLAQYLADNPEHAHR